jgi:hypothetical protein
MFEGSRSSTKRHKALTHDPLKEIGEETPPNLAHEKSTKNSFEKEKRKEYMIWHEIKMKNSQLIT